MKCVLYTCTYAGYDQVFSPARQTPGLSYVIFSDRRPRLVRSWEWRPMPAATRGMSPALVNRYCKFFPHRLFPEAEVSVYVDGNTMIVGDLSPLLAEFAASGAEIGLFAHRERGSAAAELGFAVRSGKLAAADAERGQRQLARYRAEGLPEDHALTENGVIFRRHGGPRLDAAMALWWEEITAHLPRDQISLPFVLHRTGIGAKVWDWNYKYENPYFLKYPHRDTLAVNIGTHLKMGMLQSRPKFYAYGALLYLLRFATGNFSRIEHWRPEGDLEAG
jgi:hypothetical protein